MAIMDAVDDLLQTAPYLPPHWDAAQLHPFPSPDEVPDPTAPMFPTDAGSLPDPQELQFDIHVPPVTAANPASYAISNPLVILPSSSPANQSAQLQQQHPSSTVNYSAAAAAAAHPSSAPQFATSPPSFQHSTPPASSHSRASLQQHPHAAVSQPQQQEQLQLRLQQHSAQSHPPQPAVALSRDRNHDQQGSQNSQLSLFAPPPQSQPRSSVENDHVNGHHGIAIDSNQPQVTLDAAAQARARAANGVNEQTSSRIMQQSAVGGSQKSAGRSPTRRKSNTAMQQQQHGSVQTTAKQKKGGGGSGVSQRRQLPGTQKQIGKPRTPRAQRGNGRQPKQLQQQQMSQQQKAMQGERQQSLEHQQVSVKHQAPPRQSQRDFALLGPQEESNGVPSGRNEQEISHQARQQNMYTAMGPSVSLPLLSGIPTPTTLTGTPSTTNSTHRSPPNTPHSSNRGKPSLGSGQRETQSDVHSSVDKNREDKQLGRQQSVATTNAKNSQSSTKANTQPVPTGPGSTSAQVHGTATRVTKPRDKQAKLRKRLKCCTHEQLMEQMIELVRSSEVTERVVYESTASVDINALVAKCKVSLEGIYVLLPEEPNTGPYDAETHRRCKKALTAFKNVVVNTGKTLVDANLWTDVIRYCVAAAEVNEQNPVWSEASHNKLRMSVVTKLEQFAARSVTSISKSKVDLLSSPDEHLQLAESCRKRFPAVAGQLEALERPSSNEGPVESVDFDDPMISNTRIDLSL